MKIEQIIPIRFSSDRTGLVDVIYHKRHGFLWLKTKRVARRAMSTTGVLWSWVDSPDDYLFQVSRIIDGNTPELCKGTLYINSGVRRFQLGDIL